MSNRKHQSTILSRLLPSQSLTRQLAVDGLASLILAVSSRLLMLLAGILLARELGAELYGVYVSSGAILLLLSVPLSLGFPMLLIRLLARYRTLEKWGLMKGLMARAGQLVFSVSVLFAAGGSVVAWVFRDYLEASHLYTLWWAMALLPFTTLGDLVSAALRGLHHVVLGQLADSFIKPTVFVSLLLLWIISPWGVVSSLSPAIAMALRFVGTAVAFLAAASFCFRRLPSSVLNATSQYEGRTWARGAIPLVFVGGMNIVSGQTDVLMLTVVQGAESAGVYNAAARGSDLVMFSLSVINVAIQPTIARLYAGGEVRRLQRVITLAARVTLTAALPAALLLALFGKPILTVVFGSDFSRGGLCLSILCIAQVANAATGSVGQILVMTGHEKETAIGVSIGAVANVALNAVFIPLWDIEGAALATGLSLVTWNVVLVMFVHKRLGIDSTVLGWSQYSRKCET